MRLFMGNRKVSAFRVITFYANRIGIFVCITSAIWGDADNLKLALFAAYLYLNEKLFGLNYKDERVKGSIIERHTKTLNFRYQGKL